MQVPETLRSASEDVEIIEITESFQRRGFDVPVTFTPDGTGHL